MFASLSRKALACLCAFALVAAFTASAQAAKVAKLSNQMPPSHHVSQGMHAFADKVKEYTKGSLEIQVHDAGALYRDSEIVKALRSGSVELGFLFSHRWSGLIPAMDIFESPFMFRDMNDLTAFQKQITPLLEADFQKYGAQHLAWIDYGWIQFFNSKRPLKSPADFKGLKMRSFAAIDSKTLESLGAAPTNMSSSEVYLALQRNALDGTTTGMPAAVSRKFVEVQKYMTFANYSLTQGVLQANLKWWKTLTADEQKAIMKAAAETEIMVKELVAKSEAKAKDDIAKAGLEIHVPTAAENAEFVKATASVKDAYKANAGELGAKFLDILKTITGK